MIVILLTTVVSYFSAIVIERTENTRRKKWVLVLGILVTLSFLLVFKYTDFALNSVWKVLQLFAVPIQKTTLNLVMPIGISFYTFQMVGYIADVYTGKSKAEHHFGHYALFVTFFPNILSGPIERASNMLPQFQEEKKFHYDDAAYGMRLILLGFLKKLVIADSMSRYVDNVFNHTEGASGLAFVIAIILFTFQIYCDFSGYSDIAIGVARLLGIRLMDNFKQPYYAASVREFWQRWHISLSTWFRDYIYIPLGGNRVSKARKNLNLLLTFLISGLWHGANWTFVLWGGIHGLYQIIENTIKSAWKKLKPTAAASATTVQGRSKLVQIGQTLLTFCLVAYAWMFFRANSITDAIYITTHLFQGYDLTQALLDAGMSYISVLKNLLAILALMLYDYFSLKHNLLVEIEKLKLPIRWLIYIIVAVLIIVLSLHNGVKQEFIYFKF